MSTYKAVSPELIEALRKELHHVRQASLTATRKGDFLKVARLTATTAKINRSLMDAEAQLLLEQ